MVEDKIIPDDEEDAEWNCVIDQDVKDCHPSHVAERGNDGVGYNGYDAEPEANQYTDI